MTACDDGAADGPDNDVTAAQRHVHTTDVVIYATVMAIALADRAREAADNMEAWLNYIEPVIPRAFLETPATIRDEDFLY